MASQLEKPSVDSSSHPSLTRTKPSPVPLLEPWNPRTEAWREGCKAKCRGSQAREQVLCSRSLSAS